MVRGFKKCCMSHEMDLKTRKNLGVLAINMRQDRNCEDMEAETGSRNGEQRREAE
jgi:hypothetical protein